SKNRPAIEKELNRAPVEGLTFIYYDLPNWLSWWKRGGRGVNLYHYLWQISGSSIARNWHRRFNFDVAHHLTFGRYWSPTGAAFLGLPFLWGPVGGADGVPAGF